MKASRNSSMSSPTSDQAQQNETVTSDVQRNDSSEDGGKHVDSLLDPIFDVTNLDFSTLEDFDSNIDFTGMISPKTSAKIVDYSSSDSSPSSLVPFSTPSTDQGFQVQPSITPDISIHYMPTSTIRSFNQRPRLKSSTQRTANLILHTLKSYPLMMLQDNSLPPFINAQLAYSDKWSKDMEPLNNCMNLIHMLNGRINGSRKLFWRNVRMECERWCAEVG